MVRTPSFDKNGIKKGAWSPEEDTKLEAYILRYGHWNWRELPKFAGLQRCGKSCRLRWMNYLRPNIKRGNYTKAEEDLITELHGKHGKKWAMIATRLPGRTDNEIKNHWHTHLKKRWRAENSSSPAASSDSSHVSLSGAERTRKQGDASSTTSAAVVAEDCFHHILESCPLPPQPDSTSLTHLLFGDTISSPPDCFFPDFTSLTPHLFDPAEQGFTNGINEDDLFNASAGGLLAGPTVDAGGMADIYGDLEGVDNEFWTKPFDVEATSFYNNTSSTTTSSFQNCTPENDEMLLPSYMSHHDETMVDLFFDQIITNS